MICVKSNIYCKALPVHRLCNKGLTVHAGFDQWQLSGFKAVFYYRNHGFQNTVQAVLPKRNIHRPVMIYITILKAVSTKVFSIALPPFHKYLRSKIRTNSLYYILFQSLSPLLINQIAITTWFISFCFVSSIT